MIVLDNIATPNITKHPESVAIRAGDTNKKIMYCTADGVSPLYYRWERYQSSNNSWIRPSHRVVNITSPKLVYKIIKEEDEGIYRCIVSTDHNSTVMSDNATLRVYGRFVLCTNTLWCVFPCHLQFYTVWGLGVAEKGISRKGGL